MTPPTRSPAVRWAERASAPTQWAVLGTLAAALVVIAVLSASAWHRPVVSVQILGLASLLIAFATLMWGFWGAVGGGAAAIAVGLAVVVAAGRSGLAAGEPVSRGPYLLQLLLFALLAWLCRQFLEREQTEEVADRRQLERLEEEFLEEAKAYGKREELLRALERKEERLRRLQEMEERLRRETSPERAIQACLEEVTRVAGGGEAELVMYESPDRTVRHPRGGAPAPSPDGPDEIDRWLESHRTALLVNNLTHDVRFGPAVGRERRITSIVAVPLAWDGRLRGALRLSSVSPQAFTHDDLRFATEAAGYLGSVLFGGTPTGPAG